MISCGRLRPRASRLSSVWKGQWRACSSLHRNSRVSSTWGVRSGKRAFPCRAASPADRTRPVLDGKTLTLRCASLRSRTQGFSCPAPGARHARALGPVTGKSRLPSPACAAQVELTRESLLQRSESMTYARNPSFMIHPEESESRISARQNLRKNHVGDGRLGAGERCALR